MNGPIPISLLDVERELNARGYAKSAPPVSPYVTPPVPYPQKIILPKPRPPAPPIYPPPVEIAPPVIIAEVPVVPIEIPPEEAVLVPPPRGIPLALIIGGGIVFLVLAQAFAKKEEE